MKNAIEITLKTRAQRAGTPPAKGVRSATGRDRRSNLYSESPNA